MLSSNSFGTRRQSANTSFAPVAEMFLIAQSMIDVRLLKMICAPKRVLSRPLRLASGMCFIQALFGGASQNWLN
jgi:hypothetical protein